MTKGEDNGQKGDEHDDMVTVEVSDFQAWVHMTPTKVLNLLQRYQVNMASNDYGQMYKS